MEWDAAGIVVAASPYGEGDALAAVFTEQHGVFRGLARGGLSRARAATWQTGNLVEARWVARLADQLGSYTAELVHPSAALAMADPLALGVLLAACAVAEGALPEREAQPRIFRGLLHLVVNMGQGPQAAAGLVAWELGVLADLGYGLDLSRCALTGTREGLAFVSPRTGRAVSEAASGQWRDRLLPLPPFLLPLSVPPLASPPIASPSVVPRPLVAPALAAPPLVASPLASPSLVAPPLVGSPLVGPPLVATGETDPPSVAELCQGLRLTGHFLARDAFGARHVPVPAARVMLYDRLVALDAG